MAPFAKPAAVFGKFMGQKPPAKFYFIGIGSVKILSLADCPRPLSLRAVGVVPPQPWRRLCAGTLCGRVRLFYRKSDIKIRNELEMGHL